MISPLLCKLCDNKHRDEQSDVFNNNDSDESVFHGILSHVISGNEIANLFGQVLKHISTLCNGCVIVFVESQQNTVVDNDKRIHKSNVAELIGEAFGVVHAFVVARRSDRVKLDLLLARIMPTPASRFGRAGMTIACRPPL